MAQQLEGLLESKEFRVGIASWLFRVGIGSRLFRVMVDDDLVTSHSVPVVENLVGFVTILFLFSPSAHQLPVCVALSSLIPLLSLLPLFVASFSCTTTLSRHRLVSHPRPLSQKSP